MITPSPTLYARLPAKSAHGDISSPRLVTACRTMAPSTLRGEKFPAAAPCTTINPISRRSISQRSARRIEIGASSATPAEPIAPAIAGAAATPKTTHGIKGRRPRASRIDPSTIRATVPLRSAIAKR